MEYEWREATLKAEFSVWWLLILILKKYDF